jgi:hypothetical protein
LKDCRCKALVQAAPTLLHKTVSKAIRGMFSWVQQEKEGMKYSKLRLIEAAGGGEWGEAVAFCLLVKLAEMLLAA